MPTNTNSLPLSVFHGWISAVKSDFIWHISKTASRSALRLFPLSSLIFTHIQPIRMQTYYFKHFSFSVKLTYHTQMHILSYIFLIDILYWQLWCIIQTSTHNRPGWWLSRKSIVFFSVSIQFILNVSEAWKLEKNRLIKTNKNSNLCLFFLCVFF